MINNTMHTEIKYKGKKLVIDTCDLGASYNLRYETMALLPGGEEVECVRSATLVEADRAYRLMVKKYKEQATELTGKYLKLKQDLLDAYAETEYLEQTEDGGTCNFDAPVLHLDRWNAEMIKRAAEEAGGNAWQWKAGRYVMGWVFSPRSSGQANRRSRRAEAISKAMEAKGYSVGMYYQMD